MASTIAILGAQGQLGSDLVPLLGESAMPLGHGDADLTCAEGLHARLDELQPGTVINCAAYNFVDAAEDEPERAFAVNALGVRNLATWCGEHDVPLMHISTDYVFGLHNGNAVAWMELDAPGPLSVYGNSKLAGEWFVRSLCPRHWVVRTCGLYGHRAARGKGNFVETMLRLATEQAELRVVADQRCTPTSTADFAATIADLLRTDSYGVVHATSSGECSWYEFAKEIVRQSGLSANVIPVTARDYGAKALRPDYSVLSTARLTSILERPLRSWQEALAEYLAQRSARASPS